MLQLSTSPRLARLPAEPPDSMAQPARTVLKEPPHPNSAPPSQMSCRRKTFQSATSPLDAEKSLSAAQKVFGITELVEIIVDAMGSTKCAAHPPPLEAQPRQSLSSEPLGLPNSPHLGAHEDATPSSRRAFTPAECKRALRGVNIMFAELVDKNMTELVISDRDKSRSAKASWHTPWLRADEMCRQLVGLMKLESSTRPFGARLQGFESCHVYFGTKVRRPLPASLLQNFATLLGSMKSLRRLHLVLPTQFESQIHDVIRKSTFLPIDALVYRSGSKPVIPAVPGLRELHLQLGDESDPFRCLDGSGLISIAATADLKGVVRLTIDDVAWEMNTLAAIRDTLPKLQDLSMRCTSEWATFLNPGVLQALDEMECLTTLRLQPYVELNGRYISEPGFGIFKESHSGKHNICSTWVPPIVPEYHHIRTNSTTSGSVAEIEDDPADDDSSMDTISEASNRATWNAGLTYAGEMLGRYTHVKRLVLGTTVVTIEPTPAVPLKIWYPLSPFWPVASSANMATSGHTTSVSVLIERGVLTSDRDGESDLLRNHEVRDAAVQRACEERKKEWYKTYHNVRGETEYREKYSLAPSDEAFKEGFDWAGWKYSDSERKAKRGRVRRQDV